MASFYSTRPTGAARSSAWSGSVPVPEVSPEVTANPSWFRSSEAAAMMKRKKLTGSAWGQPPEPERTGPFQRGGDGERVAWGRFGRGGGGYGHRGQSFAQYERDDGRRIDAHADLAKTGSDYTREKGGLSGSYGSSFGGLSELYRMNPKLQKQAQERAAAQGREQLMREADDFAAVEEKPRRSWAV
jgi:hypothetical protein